MKKLVIAFPLLLGACSGISLNSALNTTQQALLNARQYAAANGTIGLYPCRVTATYKIDGDANIEGPSPFSFFGGKIGGGADAGSTVVVELESPECGAKVNPNTSHPLMAPAPKGL